MAGRAIAGLEPIEVDHHDRNRRAVAPAALQNSLGALQESGSVGDTRQRIRPASHPTGNLVALLDQRENKHGGAKRKDDAFKINEAKQTHNRRYAVLAG